MPLPHESCLLLFHVCMAHMYMRARILIPALPYSETCQFPNPRSIIHKARALLYMHVFFSDTKGYCEYFSILRALGQDLGTEICSCDVLRVQSVSLMQYKPFF